MKPENQKIGLNQLVLTFIYLLVFPALLMFLSGDWLWIEGWIFSLWFLVMCASVIIYLYIHDPSLLKERYRQPGEGNQAPWDKYIVIGLFIGFIAWIFIMPLEAKRYPWIESFPILVKITGGIFLGFSYFFFYRSYKDNTFLSPLVRIQTERKHQLVTTGVYGFVRHPMYLGGILMFLGAPLLLGSCLGFILGSVITVLLCFRILGEEKVLTKEFEDYEKYKVKVKYRIFKFIW